jgi:hypothetical protein
MSLHINGIKLIQGVSLSEAKFVVSGSHEQLGSGILVCHVSKESADFNCRIINENGGKAYVEEVEKEINDDKNQETLFEFFSSMKEKIATKEILVMLSGKVVNEIFSDAKDNKIIYIIQVENVSECGLNVFFSGEEQILKWEEAEKIPMNELFVWEKSLRYGSNLNIDAALIYTT